MEGFENAKLNRRDGRLASEGEHGAELLNTHSNRAARERDVLARKHA